MFDKLNSFIKDKSIWVTLILVAGITLQGYFLHLSNIQPKKRNLVILTHSPTRLIARWDTLSHPNSKEDIKDIRSETADFFCTLNTRSTKGRFQSVQIQ